MDTYALDIAGTAFSPTVPIEAVQREGGGREVVVRYSITGSLIRSQGHQTARKVRITSPGPEWVLSAAQIATLKVLEASQTPFTVVLGPGYEVSGTFTSCLIDGDAIFEPKRGGQYANYDFTLSLA